jgi:phosphoribosylanthranilate isomerase
MTVLVKICGVKSLADARAAVESGADMLGFNFYKPSPRYIAPHEARSIIEKLPESVIPVGVYVNEESPEVVERLAEEARVQVVQLHGEESPEYCDAIRDFTVIKAIRVHAGFDPESVRRYNCEAILLDSYSPKEQGGTGKTFDWSLAAATKEYVNRLLLAGGLTVENVADAIRTVNPYAVDACSGIETAPGKKDPEKMVSFIKRVREADGKN